MERPLKKRVSAEADWAVKIVEMPHVSGISYPVFEWSFVREDGLRGGELRAWPLQGILVFQDRRGSMDFPFETVEGALGKIDEYGWGEPPHIDEVFQDIRETKKKFLAKSLEEAKQIFEELRQKWENLTTSVAS